MRRYLASLAKALPLAALGAAAACAAPAARPVTAEGPAGVSAAGELAPEERAFAEELSRRTFDYFWETTDPGHCLAPDRWPSAPFSSIAATGFALTAYGIGAERGYVNREAAAQRTLRCLEVYHDAPQGPAASGVAGYKGFFYHFLDFDGGTRHGNTELSSVDTSLLFAGVLFAQSYFDRDTAIEAAIRDTADRIYRRADWRFFLRGPDDEPAANLEGSKGLAMGWKPEQGFEPHDWIGYNEGMLIYVLALGSPSYPVTNAAWHDGWAARLEADWGEYYGFEHLAFEPLFGHQYSHIWIDFRGIRDAFMRAKGIDYFENSRRATLAQHAYAEDNPNGWKGYGDGIWGLTACDGPGWSTGREVRGVPRQFFAYAARGASPIRVVDDGTLAPTAAGGSVAFTPVLSIRALMAMRDVYGEALYTRYGFRDAFNPSFDFADYDGTSGTVVPGKGWIAGDYLGIDQGPILAMLANRESELVWRTMRKNPYIRQGLERIGFTGGWLEQ
jgi:hypothetical protein